MDAEETDIMVIGTGPGGEDAAGRLAQAHGCTHKAGNDGLIKLIQDAQRGVLVGQPSLARPAERCWALWWSPCTGGSRSRSCRP